jgi:hypothetical protein
MRGVNAGRVAAQPETNGTGPAIRSRNEDALSTGAAVVRRLRLKRRRSRVPWIYAVYHARLTTGPAGAEPVGMAEPRASRSQSPEPVNR